MTAVSIIVPVLNREKLLRDCLDSVSAQTFRKWECIVVDDGSRDRSVAVASEYAARDVRFVAAVRRRPTKGAAACRNEALHRATGRYVVFLDSDDLLHQECLRRRVDYMDQRGASVEFAVFPCMTFYNSPGDSEIVYNVRKATSDLVRFLRVDPPWQTTSPIWRTTAFRNLGGFDESLPGWQDWQVHVVALLEDYRYHVVQAQADCFHRLHEGEKISRKASRIEHIRPKAFYVRRLVAQYGEVLRAKATTRDATVGLVWTLAVKLQLNGLLNEALQGWRQLRLKRFIDARMWMQGCLALGMHGRRGGKFAWLGVRSWPETIRNSIDHSTCCTQTLDAVPANVKSSASLDRLSSC